MAQGPLHLLMLFKNSSNESTFIMFCDDDIIFEENALKKDNL